MNHVPLVYNDDFWPAISSKTLAEAPPPVTESYRQSNGELIISVVVTFITSRYLLDCHCKQCDDGGEVRTTMPCFIGTDKSQPASPWRASSRPSSSDQSKKCKSAWVLTAPSLSPS